MPQPENYFNYFTEVEEYFVSKRGRGLLVSPLDWCLIEVWRDSGVPLFIVLRGIDRSFEKAGQGGKRTPKTLFYCHPAVMEAYEEYRLAQTGARNEAGEATHPAPHEPSQEEVVQHLGRLQAAVSQLDGEAALRACKRLRDLIEEVETGQVSMEEADRTLAEVGGSLAQSLLEDMPGPRRKALKQQVRRELRLYKKRLSPEMYERMLKSHLERQVRQEFSLPEFSLLDLV